MKFQPSSGVGTPVVLKFIHNRQLQNLLLFMLLNHKTTLACSDAQWTVGFQIWYEASS